MSEMWEDVGATYVEDEVAGVGWIDQVDGTLPAEGEDCTGIVGVGLADAVQDVWSGVPEWIEDPSTDLDPDWVYNSDLGG